jgi:hypothetical protein
MTPSGIEPATFRLVAQCLYQLCSPNYKRMSYFISILWPLIYKYCIEMLILKSNNNSRTPICRPSMITVVSVRLLGKVLWLLNGGCLTGDIFLFFTKILELTRKYNSGRWPSWRTISSIICLFESSTCFEQLCVHHLGGQLYWGWAQICSKYVEDLNKLIIEETMRQVFTYQNYTKMQGQKKILPRK